MLSSQAPLDSKLNVFLKIGCEICEHTNSMWHLKSTKSSTLLLINAGLQL